MTSIPLPALQGWRHLSGSRHRPGAKPCCSLPCLRPHAPPAGPRCHLSLGLLLIRSFKAVAAWPICWIRLRLSGWLVLAGLADRPLAPRRGDGRSVAPAGGGLMACW